MKGEFWVYDNEPTSTATIHFGECSSCNHGTGVHGIVKSDNGAWLGDYDTLALAETAAHQTGRKIVRFCQRREWRKGIQPTALLGQSRAGR